MPSDQWAIGVDIGGTKIEVACVADTGRIMARKIYPTRAESGSQEIMTALVEVITEMREQVATPPQALGVGVAGQVTEEGVVTFAPNLKWRGVPLGSDLQDAVHLPTFVLNDVRAATWGEWKHGAGAGLNDLVCLFLGTGIGGGIVSGGQLLTGSNNCAGELGHMIVDFRGPECTCGNRGCLEAFAGGWALARDAKLAIQQSPAEGALLLKLADGHLEEVTARHLIQAAQQGDLFCREIVNKALEVLIAGCVGIVNGLNPSRLILGGGFAGGIPNLAEFVRGGVLRRVLDAAKESLDVVPSHLLNEAGVIGAASYALNKTGST